jgi:hypothetical protein
MRCRGLNISPTIVFLSFIFWMWLLGSPGAFLALPITLFVAVMIWTPSPRRAGWRTSSAWLTWTPATRTRDPEADRIAEQGRLLEKHKGAHPRRT